jgi:hypothetical protein
MQKALFFIFFILSSCTHVPTRTSPATYTSDSERFAMVDQLPWLEPLSAEALSQLENDTRNSYACSQLPLQLKDLNIQSSSGETKPFPRVFEAEFKAHAGRAQPTLLRAEWIDQTDSDQVSEPQILNETVQGRLHRALTLKQWPGVGPVRELRLYRVTRKGCDEIRVERHSADTQIAIAPGDVDRSALKKVLPFEREQWTAKRTVKGWVVWGLRNYSSDGLKDSRYFVRVYHKPGAQGPWPFPRSFPPDATFLFLQLEPIDQQLGWITPTSLAYLNREFQAQSKPWQRGLLEKTTNVQWYYVNEPAIPETVECLWNRIDRTLEVRSESQDEFLAQQGVVRAQIQLSEEPPGQIPHPKSLIFAVVDRDSKRVSFSPQAQCQLRLHGAKPLEKNWIEVQIQCREDGHLIDLQTVCPIR